MVVRGIKATEAGWGAAGGIWWSWELAVKVRGDWSSDQGKGEFLKFGDRFPSMLGSFVQGPLLGQVRFGQPTKDRFVVCVAGRQSIGVVKLGWAGRFLLAQPVAAPKLGPALLPVA